MSDFQASTPAVIDLTAIVAEQQNTNQLLATIHQAITALSETWSAGLVTSLGTTLQRPSNVLGVTPLAQTQATPSNPTGIAFGSTVMMGLAGTITPLVTGKVAIWISGTIFNAGGVGDGAIVQIRHGTGAAPANGAAASGTSVGGVQRFISSTTAEKVPFSLNAFVSGLSLAAHWLDVSLAATVGGTANITDVSITALELE